METLAFMGDAAYHALVALFTFERLAYLWLGVVVGLAIGFLPGIGGLTGFALLVPFTYSMDPVAAFGMLLGMSAVTNTSDSIPAIMFGVPGTSGAQALVMDGLPMTQKGEAGRALSSSYFASLLGGLFGAALLGLSIPVVRPLVLAIGTPELLCLTVFGICMVAALSGTAPLRGTVAAAFGILIGMIGTDARTGTLRWSADVLYLWDGIPLLPVLLGLFALPELCEVAVARSSLADELKYNVWRGMMQGIKDCLKSWFLIIRCSWIGSILGMIPGVTGAATDWIIYAHALRSEKGASETFTKGDVRGVIAPASADNASNGAGLLPTLAFGVPGGARDAILLSALLVHGFIPGPDMLTKHLEFTYTMVWSVALANVVGAGLCFALSGYLAKLSTVRYTLLLPSIMAIVFVGAFQGSGSWGDLFVLLVFGLIGWAMKRLRWPRPPLILGLVLGVLLERYLSISIMRYGVDWLTRPGVVTLLACSAFALVSPIYDIVRKRGFSSVMPTSRFSLRWADLMYLFFVGIPAYMLYAAQDWAFSARIGPTIVGWTAVIFGSISFLYGIFSKARAATATAGATPATSAHAEMHMDLAIEDDPSLTNWDIVLRAGIFFGWFLAFMASLAVIGFLPTLPLFMLAYMRLEGREPWWLSLLFTIIVLTTTYLVFDHLLHVPWPRSFLGDTFPVLRDMVPSM
jgi:TctA family transporter